MSDNATIARVIREVLLSLGVPREGTAYADPELDAMYESYLEPGSCYWVVEGPGGVLGGCGIARLRDADRSICELQKMYLDSRARGSGLGTGLLRVNLDWARRQGYGSVYLETMPYMDRAQELYKRNGFHYLDGPMGNTGHYSCPVHMLKEF